MRERGTLTLEECVRQMTSSPARMMGLADRGELHPGNKADIVVFDPSTVAIGLHGRRHAMRPSASSTSSSTGRSSGITVSSRGQRRVGR